MSRFLQLLLISVLTSGIVKAQGVSDNEKTDLVWNEFYDLSWEDFQGKPGESAAGDAGTSVQIQAKPYLVKNKVKYNVYVIFNRDKSWKRDESPLLLAHEQLHFDLAEVYARKIRKKISELSSEGLNDVKLFNREIQLLLEESNEVDRQYDIETLHGIMDKTQAEWEKKIKDELNALKNFRKSKQIIERVLADALYEYAFTSIQSRSKSREQLLCGPCLALSAFLKIPLKMPIKILSAKS